MSEERLETSARRPWRLRLALALGLTAVVAGAAALKGKAVLNLITPERVEASSAPDNKNKDSKTKEPPVVAVRVAEIGTISVFTTATANLVAEDEVKVVAEAEGKVLKLLVEEGQAVARGQVLVKIDEGDAALAAEKAGLAVRNADLNLERAQRMAADRLISPQDLDKVRYERDLAVQGLAEARHRLSKTTVAAPFAGHITLRRVQPGQSVKLGEELFTLADFDPLVARIFLPEREVLDLLVGQEVRLALRARDQTRFTGRIRQISPVVDVASGTVKITVEAVQPPPTVRPGAFVTVDVIRETHAQALLIPKPAVIRELQESYVFVAQGKVARKRVVQLGLEEGDRLEVVQGLKPGELVITAGQGALKDQAPISLARSSAKL